MNLPGENLSLIIHYALGEASSEDTFFIQPQSSSLTAIRSKLRLISGFSLACHRFRQIALREIFRTYRVTSPLHLHDIDRFPDIYKWVRFLHCPIEIASQVTEQTYSKFVYLRGVHLYGVAFGLVPILRRLPLTIRELILPFDHANDHALVLATISRFYNLQKLRVMSSPFEVPPVYDVQCGDIPPHHYSYSSMAAEMMKPLTLLRVLIIDHYLTDTDVHEYHATQCSWHCASDAFCPTCWEKFGEQTANAEVVCTEIMARGLKHLEEVWWKSWFTANAEGYSKVFINRGRGLDGHDSICPRRERDLLEASWRKAALSTKLGRK
ncbi:hypothetical protein Clacol_002608 [Clathrus columnatus]|uniref:F-box domain-containing protein n=1 Tax=Clathrus columnatus TaxID=1419009 RepID=A0AAV5A5B1_9AGAM|nr:hypothetical protein Clacol_002608 [Clathrus columnatus]